MHSKIYGGRNNRNSGSSESDNGGSKEITLDPSEFNILESEMDSTSPSNSRQLSRNMAADISRNMAMVSTTLNAH